MVWIVRSFIFVYFRSVRERLFFDGVHRLPRKLLWLSIDIFPLLQLVKTSVVLSFLIQLFHLNYSVYQLLGHGIRVLLIILFFCIPDWIGPRKMQWLFQSIFTSYTSSCLCFFTFCNPYKVKSKLPFPSVRLDYVRLRSWPIDSFWCKGFGSIICCFYLHPFPLYILCNPVHIVRREVGAHSGFHIVSIFS